MAPSSVRVYDNSLALESDFNDRHQFVAFSDFLMKKDCSQRSVISSSPSSSMRIDSSNIMLPPAMSPPRDSTVPLPFPPKPVKTKKKLNKQESSLLLKTHNSFNNDKKFKKSNSFDSYDEEDFKCGKFCMFRPSFGKTKSVRSSEKRDDFFSENDNKSIASALDSLEKFECGSWASSVLVDDKERFSFDFPAVETQQKRVSTGYVFDKKAVTVKGVLKTSSSFKASRRSSAESSPRRVRFSTATSVSCPTSPRSCVTPRLRKAREDFNAFLEAQNT